MYIITVKLSDFTVTDFLNLFSDVHSQITISIYGQSTINLESEHGRDLNVNLDIEEERVISGTLANLISLIKK
jgi:hypothetical protein